MRIIGRLVVFCVALSSSVQAANIDPNVFKARRQVVLDAMDAGVAVVYGGIGAVSSAGSGQFIQNSDFYYLTGVSESGAALILAPGEIVEIGVLNEADLPVE